MADTMTGLKRTNYCGETTSALTGQEVVVCGWVQKLRDKGMLVFIDLRDRSGIVQLAFDSQTAEALRQKAQSVRAEYVLMAKGTVRTRESVNKDLPNGDVEVYVSDLRILAKAQTPPFEITETTNVKEELRLRYRYLDLRRGEMQRSLIMRHRIVKAARDYYDQKGFLEIETPCLIKSTPEGARDYLVPSRVQPGKFFALPQSPQQYKQLLMLSGYDRYMQIARCFRDEDLRADRQPEFTQIDLEMSFVDEEDVMTVNEGFIKHVFREVLGKEIETPFRRLNYQEAMERFGSDKPDTLWPGAPGHHQPAGGDRVQGLPGGHRRRRLGAGHQRQGGRGEALPQGSGQIGGVCEDLPGQGAGLHPTHPGGGEFLLRKIPHPRGGKGHPGAAGGGDRGCPSHCGGRQKQRGL